MVKIVPSLVPIPDIDVHQRIVKDLRAAGFNLISFRINKLDYEAYIRRANYDQYDYYEYGSGQNFAEKSLEHYMAAKLLHLNIQDIYIDIANSNSPTPQIYNQLFGCKSYRQDLIFPEGVNGFTIGGDASKMPISDEFASAMALHCSFEHFEKDADIRFIQEASRVLKPGGRLCILPLYLHTEYAIQTDLAELPKGGFTFDIKSKEQSKKTKYVYLQY